jgi:hypothetical protein
LRRPLGDPGTLHRPDTRGGATERWSARLAWATLGIAAALGFAAVGLAIAGEADLLVVSLSVVLGLVFAVTGATLATRLPRNAIGWIFCVFALLSILSAAGDAYVTHAGDLPGRAWAAWTNGWFVNAFSPALVALSFLIFPTGAPPSPRWHALAWIIVLAASVHAVSTALAPGRLQDYPFKNPAGIEAAGWLSTIAEGSLLVLVVPLILLAAASLFARMRRASAVERQQIKWFAYAAAVMALFLVAANASRVLGEPGTTIEAVSFVLFVLVFSGIPVSMGVAILRYRLYDIDLIINRTLVYALLSAVLVLVYLGCVVALQYAFRALTGGDSQLAIVASTLAIAALFNPLRRRVQRFVDRRFYRKKYDAAGTLEAFGARLRDETDLDSLTRDLVSVVRETVQPEHASLWMHPAKSSTPAKNSSS